MVNGWISQKSFSVYLMFAYALLNFVWVLTYVYSKNKEKIANTTKK